MRGEFLLRHVLPAGLGLDLLPDWQVSRAVQWIVAYLRERFAAGFVPICLLSSDLLNQVEHLSCAQEAVEIVDYALLHIPARVMRSTSHMRR